MTLKTLISPFVFCITLSAVYANNEAGVQIGQQGRYFEKEITRRVKCRYLLYLPKDYTRNRKWPLILYLHGGIGRGDDFARMKWYPVVKMCYENDSLPFIIVSPQCAEGESWADHVLLITLLDEVIATHSVDPDRIYLAGYSMGGSGTWFLAYQYPDRFAAIAPMSGIGNRFWASRLSKIPIWVFHGAKDELIPVTETEEMVRAIEAKGGNIRVSINPERGHSPPSIEEHEQLLQWFLEQRR